MQALVNESQMANAGVPRTKKQIEAHFQDASLYQKAKQVEKTYGGGVAIPGVKEGDIEKEDGLTVPDDPRQANVGSGVCGFFISIPRGGAYLRCKAYIGISKHRDLDNHYNERDGTIHGRGRYDCSNDCSIFV